MNTGVKNIYRVLIISAFFGVLILVIFGISQVLSYLNSGADRTTLLHLPSKKERTYLPHVLWKDTLNPGRLIAPQALSELQEDYINAWYVREQALGTNHPIGIDPYYTDSAKQQLLSHIQSNTQQNIYIQGTTIAHELSLDFYSADGQLAVLTDTGVREYQRVFKNGTSVLETTMTSDYQILLLLQDGHWRIRHLIKKENKPMTKTRIPKGKGFARVCGRHICLNGQSYPIKGINYYPQKTPWDMFGTQFESKVITQDFDKIKKLGINTLRIFIPYKAFGKARVKTDKLEQLEQVLDIAELMGLKVIVTLFDFYGDYDVLDWTQTHRHAAQLVTRFKEHKAILAWDIKNEPDLDFENRGRQRVLAWLREMAIQLKTWDPNHLITIGWSNLESSVHLHEHIDIVSFHYYNAIEDFEASYAATKKNTQKPMVLQEFGLSSNWNLLYPFGASQKEQADYHRRFQKIFKKEALDHLSWTLYDFENIPNTVVGTLPWRSQKQKHFGFIDIDGNPKASFEYISK